MGMPAQSRSCRLLATALPRTLEWAADEIEWPSGRAGSTLTRCFAGRHSGGPLAPKGRQRAAKKLLGVLGISSDGHRHAESEAPPDAPANSWDEQREDGRPTPLAMEMSRLSDGVKSVPNLAATVRHW